MGPDREEVSGNSDGGEVEDRAREVKILLNPGDASHAASLSESTKYFIDNASRIDDAPSAAFYDTSGAMVSKLDSPAIYSLGSGVDL